MLKINNLNIKSNEKLILSNFGLELPTSKTMLLYGANGSGKSSLTQVILGNKDYNVSEESVVTWNDINLLELESDQISRLGIFVSYQHPVEVPGVPILSLLKLISDQHRLHRNLAKLTSKEFLIQTKAFLELLNWPQSILKRNLNEGMSGGEKKKCELLQMLTLDPDLIILDEIDSGMDKSTIQILIKIIQQMQSKNKTIIIITHNQSVFEQVQIDQKIEIIQQKSLLK